MDGSIQYINSDHWKKYLRFLLGFVFALKIFLQYTLQILLHRLLLLLYSSKTSFMRLSFLRLGRQKIKRYYTLQISWLDKYYVLTVLFLILIYSPNILSIIILNKKKLSFLNLYYQHNFCKKKFPIMQMRIFNTPNIVYTNKIHFGQTVIVICAVSVLFIVICCMKFAKWS